MNNILELNVKAKEKSQQAAAPKPAVGKVIVVNNPITWTVIGGAAYYIMPSYTIAA